MVLPAEFPNGRYEPNIPTWRLALLYMRSVTSLHIFHTSPMSCDLLADNLPKYLLRSLLVLSRCFIVVTAHYTISDEFRLLSKVS